MAEQSQKKVGLHITSGPDKTEIRTRSEAAGVKSAVRMPLRLLLVSDLTPQAPVPDRAGSSPIHAVDKDSFAALMQQMTPRLAIHVPNKLGDVPGELGVVLQFPSLEAFHPEQVARQVPALARLLETRVLADQLRGGRIDPETFRVRLQEAGEDPGRAEQLYQALLAPARKPEPAPKPVRPAPQKKEGSDALDQLLGMLSLEGGESGAEADAAGLADALAQAISGAAPSRPSVERSAADLLVADLDRLLGDQLNAILGHAAFRRLEAAWRGLKFLVDRINFREHIRLEVLAAQKADLDEALYHQVLLPEHEGAEKPPLSAIILDFAFNNGHEDIKQLEDLAGTGASLQTPLVASVDPSFFGLAEMNGLEQLSALRQLLERPAYIPWQALRKKEASAFLALALPSFLLRYRYGSDHPVKAFDFEETKDLWGGSALMVAAAVAASFARTGWPTHFTGSAGGRIEDLPLWQSRGRAIPLAACVAERMQEELAEAGFTALGCRTNHDAAYVAHAPTVRRPPVYEDVEATAEARAHATLACQLFVTRAAHFLYTFQQEQVFQLPPMQVPAALEAQLRSFLRTSAEPLPDDAVSIEHVEETGRPDQALLAVHVCPPPAVLTHPVSLVMGLRVPRPG